MLFRSCTCVCASRSPRCLLSFRNIVIASKETARRVAEIERIMDNTLKGPKVIVQDTGIGIPEDQKERIFERFYRVDKSHSKETGGTGLGLSIVKHGAILHNAEITVNSKVGEGTRMEILFEQDKSSD